jgi:GNAT superfamily N-acetyltransferase
VVNKSGTLCSIRSSKYALVDVQGYGLHAVPLPLGLNIKDYKNLSINVNKHGIVEKVCIKHDSNEMQIYPQYENIVNIGDLGDINVQAVHSYSDKTIINDLQKNHYLKPTNGITLVARLNEQIIGCAIVGRLTFGKPNKRIEFYQGKDSKLEKDTINEKIILWVKRFVVLPDCRSKGIGKLLAKQVIQFAKNYYCPKPEAIEVITSNELSDQGANEANNFLVYAGYTLVGSWEGYIKKLDKEQGCYVRTKVTKYYYIYEL